MDEYEDCENVVETSGTTTEESEEFIKEVLNFLKSEPNSNIEITNIN